MSNLLISSHPQDEALATSLSAALRRSGFVVGTASTGAGWRQDRLADLAAASVVLALWSETSVGRAGDLVQEEAELAKSRGVLLGVRIHKVAPPLGFGTGPMVDLLGWHGSPGSRAFKRLVKAIRAVAAGRPVPSPPAATWWWASAGTIALGLLGFMSDVAGLQGLLCRAPGIHSVCSSFQLGGVATPAEQLAWDKIPSGDCAALRRHLTLFPNGVYAEEASRRLTALEWVDEVRWEKKEHPLPLAVRSPNKPQPTLEQAQRVALQLADEEAAKLCEFWGQNPFNKLEGSSVAEARPDCRAIPGGFSCSVEAKAICRGVEKTVEQYERCGSTGTALAAPG